MTRFKRNLKKSGLQVIQIGGDGNCLFRSIADQLDGDQTKHVYYRKTAVDYIKRNPDQFKPFLNDSDYEEDEDPIEVYCKQMAKDSKWGGQHEINALAQKCKFNVFMHQVGSPSLMHVFHNPIEDYPIVHLSYHRGCHYNSVRRIDDP